MSAELISVLVFLGLFAVAAAVPVNMGILGFAATFVVGTFIVGADAKTLTAGFPAGLFLTLAGITYLFAIARINGTIDWLVALACRAVAGRIAAIPWMMFATTALLTAAGASAPAAIALIAPVGLTFAQRYPINPLLMGLMVIHGSQAGAFSPISIFGGITQGIASQAGLPVDAVFTFLMSLFVNAAIAAALFLVLGGLKLFRNRNCTEPGVPDAENISGKVGVEFQQLATLAGILALALLVLIFQFDIGLTAITIGLLLSLINPKGNQKAVSQISWPEIMLITGVGTYVALLEKMGTISVVGEGVAGIGSPLFAALVLCFIGGAVSAFASSTAVLGSLIPLSIPLLKASSSLEPTGLITAMVISSTVVDVSPFSTAGALVLAAAPEGERQKLFRRMVGYAILVTFFGPILLWLLLVVAPHV